MNIRSAAFIALFAIMGVLPALILHLFRPLSVLAACVLTVLSVGVVYALFSRFGWRWWVWRRIGLVSEPYLGGEWRVTLSSSYNSNATLHGARVEIVQHWRQMKVIFVREDQDSISLAATLYQEDGQWFLTYIYRLQPRQNEVDPDGRPTAQFGLAVLRLLDDKYASGTYHYLAGGQVNGGNSVVVGQIVFKRGFEITDPPMMAADG